MSGDERAAVDGNTVFYRTSQRVPSGTEGKKDRLFLY